MIDVVVSQSVSAFQVQTVQMYKYNASVTELALIFGHYYYYYYAVDDAR